jgi:hypothetical protein
MTTAKWSIKIIWEQLDLRHLAARFNEKECLPVRGGDALSLLLDPQPVKKILQAIDARVI